jgi:hypothetical protein
VDDYVRRLYPDSHSIEGDRLIGEHRWGVGSHQPGRGAVGSCVNEELDHDTSVAGRARKLNSRLIKSKLTAMRTDERALSVSGYVCRGEVKYTDYALNKVGTHKRRSKNHTIDRFDAFG